MPYGVVDRTKQQLDQPELGRELDALRVSECSSKANEPFFDISSCQVSGYLVSITHRLELVVRGAVDHRADARVAIELLEERAGLDVVAHLRDGEGQRVGAVAGPGQLVGGSLSASACRPHPLSHQQDVEDHVAILAGGLIHQRELASGQRTWPSVTAIMSTGFWSCPERAGCSSNGKMTFWSICEPKGVRPLNLTCETSWTASASVRRPLPWTCEFMKRTWMPGGSDSLVLADAPSVSNSEAANATRPMMSLRSSIRSPFSSLRGSARDTRMIDAQLHRPAIVEEEHGVEQRQLAEVDGLESAPSRRHGRTISIGSRHCCETFSRAPEDATRWAIC